MTGYEYAVRCPNGTLQHLRPPFAAADHDRQKLDHYHRNQQSRLDGPPCTAKSHVVVRRPVGEWEQAVEEAGTLL